MRNFIFYNLPSIYMRSYMSRSKRILLGGKKPKTENRKRQKRRHVIIYRKTNYRHLIYIYIYIYSYTTI